MSTNRQNYKTKKEIKKKVRLKSLDHRLASQSRGVMFSSFELCFFSTLCLCLSFCLNILDFF